MFISLPLRQRPRVPLGWDQASPGRTRTLAGPGPAVRRGRVSRSKRVRPFVKRTVFGTLTGRLESLYCYINNISFPYSKHSIVIRTSTAHLSFIRKQDAPDSPHPFSGTATSRYWVWRASLDF